MAVCSDNFNGWVLSIMVESDEVIAQIRSQHSVGLTFIINLHFEADADPCFQADFPLGQGVPFDYYKTLEGSSQCSDPCLWHLHARHPHLNR